MRRGHEATPPSVSEEDGETISSVGNMNVDRKPRTCLVPSQHAPRCVVWKWLQTPRWRTLDKTGTGRRRYLTTSLFGGRSRLARGGPWPLPRHKLAPEATLTR